MTRVRTILERLEKIVKFIKNKDYAVLLEMLI